MNAERRSDYHIVCKICGAPRYEQGRTPYCKWHHHEYERERHAAWREKRKAQQKKGASA